MTRLKDAQIFGVVVCNGHIKQLHTSAGGYDVDYCERDDQYYYHCSGDHGTQYPGYRELHEPMSGEQLFSLFSMIRKRTHYCGTCEDRLPRDNLCDHLHWGEDSIVVNEDGEPR